MKILKFMVISVVVCFLGGYATMAFSSQSATSWGNAFPNSSLLNLVIDVKLCISNKNNRPKKIDIPDRAPIVGIGAVVISSQTQPKEKTVAIHVIPYVRAKNRKDHKIRPLYLIPNRDFEKHFNKFYTSCGQNYNSPLADKYLEIYPLALLHVDNKKNLDKLVARLKKKRYKKFLSKDISTKSVGNNVRELLKTVLSKKQAQFLKGLPFNVCVELIDEKRTSVKFLVKNSGDSNPCNRGAIDREANTSSQTTSESSAVESNQAESSTTSAQNSDNVASPQLTEAEPHGEESQQCVGDQTKKIDQLQKEKFDLEKDRDFHKVKRDEADKQIAKLKEEKKRLRSKIQTNPELQRLERQVEQLKKELDDTIAKLPQSGNGKSAGNHRLIVVSLSNDYSRTEKKAIQESLFQVFSTAKTTGIPVTLVTIGSGRQRHSLLTSQELQRLRPTGGLDSILGQIESGVRFGARDLWALGDLGKEVDDLIRLKEDGTEAIGQVLYLTDNTRLPDKPANKERGVPLAWREDGIALTVMTTKECQVWEKSVRATCVSWETEDELKNGLNAFIQQGNGNQ